MQILKKDLPVNPEDENDTYRTLTIGEGVKLVLPYLENGTATTNTVNTADQSITATLNGGSTVATDAQCSTKVILGSGVELAVAGDMIISGQLDGGGGDKPYCGQTSGNHARLILNPNSKITVSGHLRVPGFIIESSTNNGSKIIVESNGTIYQPFVVRDFKGGSITGGIYYGMDGHYCTPFNQFAFMNVEPEVEIHGYMIGYVNIYAGSKHNPAAAKMIGKSSDTGTSRSFVEFTTDSSYLVAKYNNTTQILDLDFYGGAETKDFKFTVEFMGTNYTASSDMFVFPISWMYDITLHNGTYDMTGGNRFKLLPGSNFTVESDATLQIAHLSIYESFADEMKVRPYPSNYESIYGNIANPPFTGALPGARFMLRGTLKVSTIGGKVYTDTPDAKVIFVSLDGRPISTKITNYEPAEIEDGAMYDPITRYTAFVTTLKLYYEYKDSNNQIQNNMVGYISTSSEYTSTSTGYTWVPTPDVVIPTRDGAVQLTIYPGENVWTDEAVLFDENGVFDRYYIYDSTVDGPMTIYLFPGAEVKYTLTSGQIYKDDGNTTEKYNSAQEVKTSNYIKTWEANTSSTPIVYNVPVLNLNGNYTFLQECSITYNLTPSTRTGTVSVNFVSKYDISIQNGGSYVEMKEFWINGSSVSKTTHWLWGTTSYYYTKTFSSDAELTITS